MAALSPRGFSLFQVTLVLPRNHTRAGFALVVPLVNLRVNPRMLRWLAASFLLEAAALAPRKIALVTGANKGIGFEIARALGNDGMTVVLGCRARELGETAARRLSAAGVDAVFSHLDLTQPESWSSVHDFVAEKYGRLDVCVNNAAICFNDPTLYGRCAPTPFQAQADITVRTNFFGTLGVTRAMLPLLRASSSAWRPRLSPRLLLRRWCRPSARPCCWVAQYCGDSAGALRGWILQVGPR